MSKFQLVDPKELLNKLNEFSSKYYHSVIELQNSNKGISRLVNKLKWRDKYISELEQKLDLLEDQLMAAFDDDINNDLALASVG